MCEFNREFNIGFDAFDQKRRGRSIAAGYKRLHLDEVDEGTAIFKCTNDVPVGKSTFATFEGLPSDFSLKLVGSGAS